MTRTKQAVVAVAVLATMGTVVACAPPPDTPVLPGVAVAYRSFEGAELELLAYTGREVALLVPPDRGWSPSVSTRIVAALDDAYDYYERITGAEPYRWIVHEGRATVAVVPETCGAGCGYLGATGIELEDSYGQLLYEGVRDHGWFDQVVFYELGRNFWFLDQQLGYHGDDFSASVITGFATLNRFTSMEAAGVRGGPFNGDPFEAFEQRVRGLVDIYEATPSATWANTLKVGNGVGGWDPTDLFASFILRLEDHFGERIHERLWIEAAARPPATTTAQAVDNFVLAASAAAGRNLTELFATDWRFPVSAAARATAQQRWGAPWSAPG